MKNLRLVINDFLAQIQWGAVLVVLISATWWWRVKWWQKLEAPDWLNLPDLYFAHFGFALFVLVSVAAWLLGGCRGLSNTLSNGNILWLIPLFQLAIWTRITYGEDTLNPTVAMSYATMWIATAVFTLSVTANPPPLTWILGALIAGMLLQGILGITQVALQHDLGIYSLNEKFGVNTGIGELPLNPDASGVSVVIGNGIRFLRPYGFGAHPNMMVPAIVVGFFAGMAWLVTWKQQWAAAVMVIAWWSLLLSFSRAALGGMVVGLVVMGGMWVFWKYRSTSVGARYIASDKNDQPPADRINLVPTDLPHPLTPYPASGEGEVESQVPPRLRGRDLGWGRNIFSTAILLILTTALFIGMYAPLMGVRFGVQQTEAATFEDYSAASRAVYQEQAIELIGEHRWLGVGIGNMAWHSAFMLQFDPSDLRGQPVHNIYLLALSEVGLIGFGLFMASLLIGFALTLRRAWLGKLMPAQIGLMGAVVALLAIGWFDHYLWSQFGHLLLFWIVFASMLHTTTELTEKQLTLVDDTQFKSAD